MPSRCDWRRPRCETLVGLLWPDHQASGSIVLRSTAAGPPHAVAPRLCVRWSVIKLVNCSPEERYDADEQQESEGCESPIPCGERGKAENDEHDAGNQDEQACTR